MNESFEDQLRRAIHSDEVEIRSDPEQAIRTGRRIVRGRRLGWGLAAAAVVVVAALALPGILQRTLPAVPAVTAVPASASPAAAGILIGTEWKVVRLGGAELVSGTSITLAFGEDTVTGFGGCNGFGYGELDGQVVNGWYRQAGDRLAIGRVVATWKGCPGGIGEQETRYFEALTSVQRFVVSGDSLRLLGADDTVLVELERVPVKLDRTGWQVTSINGAAPLAERQPTLLFRNGAAIAYDGCNWNTGSYSQEGARLRFTNQAITLLQCPEPTVEPPESTVQRPEQDFFKAFSQVASAVLEGGRLHLLDAAGATVLEAVPDAALLLAAEKSTWRLDNSSGLWGKGEQSSITLRVESHRLSGRSGCGDYTADLTHDGNSWSVSSATREPVPCPSTAGQPADRFLGLLEKVTRVELEDAQLRLVTPSETLLFTSD